MVVISAGGKELGERGEELEATIRRLARDNDVRVVGCNCIGVLDSGTHFDTFFYAAERMVRPPTGPIALMTQSGTVGAVFLERLSGTGVSKFVSYGNRIDVDEGDLLAFFADDPSTKVIACYLEGLEDGRKFLIRSIRRRGEEARRCLQGGAHPTGRDRIGIPHRFFGREPSSPRGSLRTGRHHLGRQHRRTGRRRQGAGDAATRRRGTRRPYQQRGRGLRPGDRPAFLIRPRNAGPVGRDDRSNFVRRTRRITWPRTRSTSRVRPRARTTRSASRRSSRSRTWMW